MWEHSLIQMMQRKQTPITDAPMERLHLTIVWYSHSSTLARIRTITYLCNSTIVTSLSQTISSEMHSWTSWYPLKTYQSVNAHLSLPNNIMKVILARSSPSWSLNLKTIQHSIYQLSRETPKLGKSLPKEKLGFKSIFFLRISKRLMYLIIF